MIVTLTGTMGGPPEFNGLAGPGTLVRYGDDADNCSAVRMQFDAGRGTSNAVFAANIPPAQINAVFFTHMHSDHADGFADLIQLRWHFNSKGPSSTWYAAPILCRPRLHHQLPEICCPCRRRLSSNRARSLSASPRTKSALRVGPPTRPPYDL